MLQYCYISVRKERNSSKFANISASHIIDNRINRLFRGIINSGENMSISKKIVAALFTAAVLLSAVILLVEGTANDEPEQPTPKSEISAEKENYRVKEYNGRIAVFIDGNETPLYTLETPLVNELPQYDRDILEKGIIAESNAELLQILEDYDN